MNERPADLQLLNCLMNVRRARSTIFLSLPSSLYQLSYFDFAGLFCFLSRKSGTLSSTRFPPPSSHPFGSAWEAKGLMLVLTSGSSRRGTGRDLGLGSLQPPPALQLIFKELVSPFMNRGFLALSPLLIGATERGIPSLLRVLHLHPTPRTGFALPPFRVPASPASSALLLCPNWSLVVSVVWVSCLTSLRKWCAQSVNSFTTNAFGKPRVTVSLLEICLPLTGECWTLYRAAL